MHCANSSAVQLTMAYLIGGKIKWSAKKREPRRQDNLIARSKRRSNAWKENKGPRKILQGQLKKKKTSNKAPYDATYVHTPSSILADTIANGTPLVRCNVANTPGAYEGYEENSDCEQHGLYKQSAA